MTKNIKIIIAIVAVIVLIAIAFLMFSSRSSVDAPILNLGSNTQNENKKPNDTTINLTRTGESYNLSLASKTQKTLTGFSVRLTYPNSGADYSTQVFTPNSELVQGGWVFPIKTITLDNDKNVINVDISGINLGTEGYTLTNEVSLGTLNNFPVLTFTADQSQTKILEKSGEEINYTFKQQ